jgi:hypothetical protein
MVPGTAANCTGLVIEKTLAQIKTCDVGSWFNDAFPQYARAEYVGLQIPTLEELFQRYRHRANYYRRTPRTHREWRRSFSRSSMHTTSATMPSVEIRC